MPDFDAINPSQPTWPVRPVGDSGKQQPRQENKKRPKPVPASGDTASEKDDDDSTHVDEYA